MPRPRIAIAGFQHETNTFSPIITEFNAFLDGGGWPGLTLGRDVCRVFKGLNIPLGGFLDAAPDQVEIIPILWTSAEPAAHVTRNAFEHIMAMILDGLADAAPFDGVYLDLHGAMVTQDHLDGEAEILRRVRELVGDRPIAVSLDLHANLSADVVDLADAITIYRTYPHLDMGETGARAWTLLRDLIETGARPAKAFRRLLNLIPLSAQCTDFGPLATFYATVATEDVISADAALGFPLADTPVAGPSVVVYASDQVRADQRAHDLAALLEYTAGKVDNSLLEPEDAVAQARDLTQQGGTVVLADVQDNSGAGAMADSTGLLAAMIQSGVERCLLGTLWDPEAAGLAHDAGIGACLSLSLGGKSGPSGVEPFHCQAKVIALSDGHFTCTGAMQRGVETDIGRSALLRVEANGGDVTVLVSSLRHQTIDAQAFRHIGAQPEDFRIVGVKSTVHFRADFAELSRAVLMVEAPGYSTCRLDQLNFRCR